MGNCFWRATLVAVTATLPVSLAGCGDSIMLPAIDVRETMVVGNELRVVVETSRSVDGAGSHSSTIADTQGYLVAIDLSSSQPLEERSKVYGPLWDVADPRSTISFEAGAKYSKRDSDAAAATPLCLFNSDGTLLRFQRDRIRHGMVRDALTLTAAGGSWKRVGDVKRVDDRTAPMSEDRLETPSRRSVLLFQDKEAKLFDHFTGEPIDDEWLAASFAHARSNQTLGNVRMFVTEDLNHLVVSPLAIWNRDGKVFETFELDGETLQRAEVGLSYDRPSKKPVTFPRRLEDPDAFLSEAPHGAISIGGKLFLFAHDERSLRLYQPDGSDEMRIEGEDAPVWPLKSVLKMHHLSDKGELVLLVGNDVTVESLRERPQSVVRWNYRDSTIARFDVKVGDLFEEREGRLLPKAVKRVR